MVTLKESDTSLLHFDEFFKQYPHENFKKKSIILRSGTIPREVFYIKKGYSKAYAVSPEGEELTMIIFQPGDFFPLISTMESKKVNYYIEAMTDLELIRVPRIKFIEFLKNREDLLSDFTMRLTARFEGVLLRMQYLVFGSASQKLASILVILAERFGREVKDTVIVKAPLTHKDLASLVGITRETTTLILKQLVKEGFIEIVKKQIVVKNLKHLRDYSLIEEGEHIIS